MSNVGTAHDLPVVPCASRHARSSESLLDPEKICHRPPADDTVDISPAHDGFVGAVDEVLALWPSTRQTSLPPGSSLGEERIFIPCPPKRGGVSILTRLGGRR